MPRKWDIIILGGGPGGYVAALRATQLKKRVLLIEKDKVGGTCMNYGCIPTKYLLHQTKLISEIKKSKIVDGPLDKLRFNLEKMLKEKQKVVEQLVQGLNFILKKKGVEVINGEASLKSENEVTVQTGEGEILIESEKIILATGSRPGELPFIIPNGKEVVTSKEALEIGTIPKKMLIIGAGTIGIEFGIIFQRLGSDVTILEIMPTILPGWDKEIVSRLQRILKTQGLRIFTQMRIDESLIEDGLICLRGTCLKDSTSFEFKGEKVLLAVGRRPNSDYFKSTPVNISVDEYGFIRVNPHFETNIPGIYAIGDVIGGKLLAHKASHEGLIAAENASGAKKTVDYETMPMAVYAEPELSSVGLTEEEAQERGIKTKVGRFPLRASGRALTMGKEEGIVKIVADENDKIIGAHILAPNASEIVAEITLAIGKGLKLQDVASSIHIHPTLSEAVMEASMKARGMALHIMNI